MYLVYVYFLMICVINVFIDKQFIKFNKKLLFAVSFWNWDVICIISMVNIFPLFPRYARRVSDCWLMQSKQFFSYIMARTSYNVMWLISVLYLINMLCRIFIVLAHWNNSPWLEILLNSDTSSRLWAKQSFLFHLNIVCLDEKQQIPIF
jgi:hypothetical protein